MPLFKSNVLKKKMADTQKKESRGGAGRGQGRKPKPDGAMVSVTHHVTPAQKEKLKRLGGGKWLRPTIDNAKED